MVSIGGGSASDTAKAIATFDAEEDRTIDEMKSQMTEEGEVYVPSLPEPKSSLVAVATTFSAVEVSNAFGVTDVQRGEKGVIVDEKVRPITSYCDPELTATTPSAVVTSTGMSALDHAVEILYSDPRGENSFYQATASCAIELLMNSLPATVADPDDTAAAEGAQVGAALSAMGSSVASASIMVSTTRSVLVTPSPTATATVFSCHTVLRSILLRSRSVLGASPWRWTLTSMSATTRRTSGGSSNRFVTCR